MKKIIALAFGGISFAAQAQTSNSTIQLEQNNLYIPQVYVQGYAGDNILGRFDILAPLYHTSDRAFFFYGQGRVSDYDNDDSVEQNQNIPWTLSGGFGYRQMPTTDSILGAFLLVDYNRTTANENFWDISPGIEYLGKNWDFRANGYFPISTKSWTEEGWADDFGVYDYNKFSNHEQYDQWVSVYNYQQAATGGDAEVGRKLFKINNILVKGYLGGYYFDTQDNGNITGGSARITIKSSEYLEFSVNDTYDNQYHNTFMVGARVRLNDLFSKHPKNTIVEDQDVSVRLLDPVERNLGTLNLSTSVPVITGGNMTLQGESLEKDHIWFFNPETATASADADAEEVNGSGTYEDPFTGINQEEMSYIQQSPDGDHYATLYFSPGAYSLDGFDNSRIALPESYDMWGRTSDYTAPAQGTDRATFYGGIDLLEGDNTLDSIILYNNYGQQSVGIEIGEKENATAGEKEQTTSDITLNNVQVGSLDSDNGYLTSLYAVHANQILLNNSTLYAYNYGGTEATGIYADDSNLTINKNNTVIAQAYGIEENNQDSLESSYIAVNSTAYGIRLLNSTVNIGSNNDISAFAKGGTASSQSTDYASVFAFSQAFGIYATDNSLVNIDCKNSVSSTVIGGNATTLSSEYGISMSSSFADSYGVNAIDSQVNINENNYISANATGGYASSSSDYSSNVDANAFSYGISSDNSTIALNKNNTIESQASGGNSYVTKSGNSDGASDATSTGISANNNSIININYHNTINSESNGGLTDFDITNEQTDISANASSYGINASDSNVNIGNNNTIEANAMAGQTNINIIGDPSSDLGFGTSFTEYSTATASGIQSKNGSLSIDDNNAINASANGGDAVITKNSNNIADLLVAYSSATANGINTQSSTVDIDNRNSINSSAVGGTSFISDAANDTSYSMSTAESNSINVFDSNLTVGNKNALSSFANGGSASIAPPTTGTNGSSRATDSSSKSVDIKNTSSNTTVGNNNTLSSNSIGGTTTGGDYNYDSALAYGISILKSASLPDPSSVVISGGNVFNISASSPQFGGSIGIRAESQTSLTFDVSGDNYSDNVFNINGEDESYGINASASAILKIKTDSGEEVVTDLTDLLDYNQFYNYGSPIGSMIIWGSNFIDWPTL